MAIRGKLGISFGNKQQDHAIRRVMYAPNAKISDFNGACVIVPGNNMFSMVAGYELAQLPLKNCRIVFTGGTNSGYGKGGLEFHIANVVDVLHWKEIYRLSPIKFIQLLSMVLMNQTYKEEALLKSEAEKMNREFLFHFTGQNDRKNIDICLENHAANTWQNFEYPLENRMLTGYKKIIVFAPWEEKVRMLKTAETVLAGTGKEVMAYTYKTLVSKRWTRNPLARTYVDSSINRMKKYGDIYDENANHTKTEPNGKVIHGINLGEALRQRLQSVVK